MTSQNPSLAQMILMILIAFSIQISSSIFFNSFFWPNFPILLVLHYCLNLKRPRAISIRFGFIVGLGLDIYGSNILGQNALALSISSYIAINQYLQIKTKSLLQQSIFILLLLILNETVLYLIDGWTRQPTGGIERWLYIPPSILLWYFTVMWLDHSPYKKTLV